MSGGGGDESDHGEAGDGVGAVERISMCGFDGFGATPQRRSDDGSWTVCLVWSQLTRAWQVTSFVL